jgi:hypothetical protein
VGQTPQPPAVGHVLDDIIGQYINAKAFSPLAAGQIKAQPLFLMAFWPALGPFSNRANLD